MNQQNALKGKIDIRASLKVESGLHIGGSSDFAPIGAVDSPFIRDALTKEPIIPGSSLKGKIRTLLARSMSKTYLLNKIEDDDEKIARLFGSASRNNEGCRPSRLQFFDLRLKRESLDSLSSLDLDTYIGEIKWENTIDRISATANPRQIERVPAGAEFAFRLVYNVEDERQLDEDMKMLQEGLFLLQMDYLGGHGSRGYGRVSLNDFSLQYFSVGKADTLPQEKLAAITGWLEKPSQAKDE